MQLQASDTILSLGEQLSAIVADISFFAPEVCLSVFLLLNIFWDLLFKNKNSWVFTASAIAGFVATLAFTLQQWAMVASVEERLLFSDMLQLDRLAVYFKLLICLSALLVVLTSVHYKSRSESISLRPVRRIGEYYTVTYGLVLGAMLLAMSTHLLMIYLSIELISISSYILTNFNLDRRSAEASIKYVIFGSVASGLMLYGISLLYGLTGTLMLTSAAFQAGVAAAPWLLLVVAALLVLGGFLFKISSIPFHIWAPDVYEGAPTPVAAFFSIVPKAAGFAVLLRYTALFLLEAGEVFPWQTVLAVIAGVTIIVGNFAALWQTNAKRMMAYSSIAHSGFVLIGILSATELGMLSVLFYLGIYALMNLAAFLIIRMMDAKTGSEDIRHYQGLGLQYPFLGVMMLIAMVSLTGLPPTAGFTAKLLVFTSLWSAYQLSEDNLMLLLLVIGLFNTVVSLFYYLKIPYYMFFRKGETSANAVEFMQQEQHQQGTTYRFNLFDKILAFVLIIPLLILFFKSNWLVEFISSIPFKF